MKLWNIKHQKDIVNPYVKLLGSTAIMSDREEEIPVSRIQLSEENWLILKEFFHKEINKYLDRLPTEHNFGGYFHTILAFEFGQQFQMKRQKLLDQQCKYRCSNYIFD